MKKILSKTRYIVHVVCCLVAFFLSTSCNKNAITVNCKILNLEKNLDKHVTISYVLTQGKDGEIVVSPSSRKNARTLNLSSTNERFHEITLIGAGDERTLGIVNLKGEVFNVLLRNAAGKSVSYQVVDYSGQVPEGQISATLKLLD